MKYQNDTLMKTKVFFLVSMLLLAGSQGIQSQSGSLPVVDVSKNYSLEKLNLQDMASVEYVPLEIGRAHV